jgi:hypothetical protein
MKRTFLAVLGTLLLGACTNDDTPNVSEEVNEGGNRYLAVSLVANAQTRADGDGTFAEGEDTEYTVPDATKVVFYFFDANGNAFNVDDDKNYVTATEITWDANAPTSGAITNKSDALAVLKTKKGEIPTQVVAIVNYGFTLANKSLSELSELSIGSDEYYYTKDSKNYLSMSNSVYYDGSKIINTTQITAANLGTTAELAAEKPVTIYVERMVAKVTVEKPSGPFDVLEKGTSADTNVGFTIYGTTTEGNTEIEKVQANVIGWNLFNTAKATTLQKQLTALTDATWTWNDVTNYRTYWSDAKPDIENTKLSWTSMSQNNPSADTTPVAYPFENTQDNTTSDDGKTTTDLHTSVAIAAQLTDGTNALPTFGNWMGNYYTEARMKELIAEFLQNDLCQYTAGTDGAADTYTPITTSDIELEVVENKEWQESVVLTDEAAKKDWYKKGSTTKIEDVSTILNAVPKAQIFKEGKCYYFTAIKHTPKADNAEAVVRNHWYAVKVNKIYGLGTPVYDVDQNVDPVTPGVYDQWYLDAKINIQAWNKITNNVDLTSN